MKSICNFAYAAVLTLSALNFAPSVASAQDATGTFTLTHKVHWQNAVVPAGTYRFIIEPDGPAAMLTLRNLSGGKSFMMLVVDSEDSKPKDISQLVLVSRPAGSFVSTLQLPEFGMTLRFAVPSKTPEVARTVASAGTTLTAPGTR
jgi:hypothetical protein